MCSRRTSSLAASCASFSCHKKQWTRDSLKQSWLHSRQRAACRSLGPWSGRLSLFAGSEVNTNDSTPTPPTPTKKPHQKRWTRDSLKLCWLHSWQRAACRSPGPWPGRLSPFAGPEVNTNDSTLYTPPPPPPQKKTHIKTVNEGLTEAILAS